jgi:site-specific DNA-methyltransferase (adenine-specific)
MIQLYNGDCLELMKNIPDGSVDLVLCDPPYGTMKGANLDGWSGGTKTDWDIKLPTEEMFFNISRVLRKNGKCVLFSQEPYTSEIITRVIPQMLFCYRGVWVKDNLANPLMAKKAMVNYYEDFCVFTNKETNGGLHKLTSKITDLVMEIGFDNFAEIMMGEGRYKNLSSAKIATHKKIHLDGWNDYDSNPFDEKMYRYLQTQIEMPYTFDEYFSIVAEYKENTKSIFNLWQGGKSKANVLEYAKDNDGYHPTQKPVKLLEDLIQTYSNEGNTVLDFTMGSGSTGVACVNTNRNFIGIELDKGYFDIAEKRINEAQNI